MQRRPTVGTAMVVFFMHSRIELGTMSWQQALERTVTGLGYDLVDVERSAGGLLRVTIDRLPGQAYSTGSGEFVLVEDCEIVTRQLQYVFEVESVDYDRLEVSSPGLDRPLKKLADWRRFVGSQIEVTLRAAFQGRKKWCGALLAPVASPAVATSAARLVVVDVVASELPAEPAASVDGLVWRLLLPNDRPTSRTALKRAAKAAAAGLADAAPAQETLDFLLDEVREARLVPTVDFNGRRGALSEDGLQDTVSERVAEKVDGGQD